MCLWISVSGFNLRMDIEYIYSLLLCAKSSLTMWNNLQKACQSNQLHTPPVHFRKHSQCTSKSHMQEKHTVWVARRDQTALTALASQWPLYHRDRQAMRKPVPFWLKLLIRHSLFCSLIHMQPPTCHFSWGLNSDEVKVADFRTGGQRFCCPKHPVRHNVLGHRQVSLCEEDFIFGWILDGQFIINLLY